MLDIRTGGRGSGKTYNSRENSHCPLCGARFNSIDSNWGKDVFLCRSAFDSYGDKENLFTSYMCKTRAKLKEFLKDSDDAEAKEILSSLE